MRNLLGQIDTGKLNFKEKPNLEKLHRVDRHAN